MSSPSCDFLFASLHLYFSHFFLIITFYFRNFTVIFLLLWYQMFFFLLSKCDVCCGKFCSIVGVSHALYQIRNSVELFSVQ